MIPERKNTRLKDFDYSKCGAYFVTICTQNRMNLLSRIELSDDGEDRFASDNNELCRGDPCGRPTIKLTPIGIIARKTLDEIEKRFDVKIDECVIMPDHIHMILLLNIGRETSRVSPTKDGNHQKVTLGRVVGTYKSLVANEWRHICNEKGIAKGKIWQRGYYDHIVRSRDELTEVCKYIRDNPARRYYNTIKD